jgi:hypothetical protein
MSMPIDPSKTPKQTNAVNAKRGDKISRVPITLRIVSSKADVAANRVATLIVTPDHLGNFLAHTLKKTGL